MLLVKLLDAYIVRMSPIMSRHARDKPSRQALSSNRDELRRQVQDCS